MSNLSNLYVFASFMISISSLLLILISSFIIYDHDDVTSTAEDIKDTLKVEVVTDSFQEYYSVFNKQGGWFNLSYLMLGVGLTSFIVSILGYFNVHSKTVFLLLSFVFLQLVMIMLQIGAVMLLGWRKLELLQFYYFSNSSKPLSDFHHEVKQILLVLSLMWSTVTLLLCVITIVIRFRSKRKENQLDLETV